MTFSADAYSILPEDGLFIVSGIIGQKRDLVKDDLLNKGFEIIESVLWKIGLQLSLKKGACDNLQRYFLENHLMRMGMQPLLGMTENILSSVMRMGVGDQVIAVSDGEAYIADDYRIIIWMVSLFNKMEGSLPSNEMPVNVTIACGLTKR